LKIAFLNVNGIGNNDGSRLISSIVKRAGHTIKSVFFANKGSNVFGEYELDKLDEILKNSDMVMISVYSHYALRAVHATQFIRKKYPGMKVFWGGPHCISAPELSLPYADGICFAEGDCVVVDLINKMESGIDYMDTLNMAFNVNGILVKNSVKSPTLDLDSLPYPDYNLDEQFVLDGELHQMNKEKLQEHYTVYPFGNPTFWLMTARGCPYLCTYCNNARYFSMHGRNPMRFRSVDNFIGELELILNKFDFFKYVAFGDDDFLIRPVKELEDFARKYKDKVGLPFAIEISANTYRKEKLEILLDAGLKVVEMGVQSGSQRVLDEVFKRPIKVDKTKEIAAQLETYKNRYGLCLMLDFIIDNPYETPADIIQTYKYIINVFVTTRINLFVLAFFPGTPLYDRALKDGFIKSFSEETFRHYVVSKNRIVYQNNYATLLVLLAIRHRIRSLPKLILNMLGSGWAQSIGALLPKRFYNLLINFIK